MKLEEIGFYTLSDARAAGSSSMSQLQRAELILTPQCNFHCPYCRGLRPDCAKPMPLDKAKEVLAQWIRHGLVNVRFSGGEPMLYKGLAELVSQAAAGGVRNIAISTNGSASFKRYQELVALGVTDFSISLDACCSSSGEKMSGGVKGAWEKVTENIRLLSPIVYVTVGVVLTEDNAEEVAGISRLAHDLGVADIRIIPAAQFSKTLADKIEKMDFGTKHPIFRYRLANALSGKSVRGLEAGDNPRCPLVLDDIAVAGRWHFPCIIYLREKGDPIGEMGDMEKVREERRQWAETHDCQADPICKGQCLDACREFNNKVRSFRKADLPPR
jgi:MoaA/NifB/PqqE/SkfB family radical SAM enzyme